MKEFLRFLVATPAFAETKHRLRAGRLLGMAMMLHFSDVSYNEAIELKKFFSAIINKSGGL
ncbi:MAG: hypothetical protein AB1728_11160 [Bacteroidota bacterium]